MTAACVAETHVVKFQEFAQKINDKVDAKSGQFSGPSQTAASWKAGSRSAEIELVEPRNIKLTLEGEGGATTWYPIDDALVQLVAKRVTGFLAEA